MASYSNPYVVAAESNPAERGQFIRRTYAHLAGALLAFAALTGVLVTLFGPALSQLMVGGKFSWLIVLALFMGASWIAQKWADSDASPSMQYAGLGLYVVAEAIIFVPILTIASRMDSYIIPMAGMITLGLFLGLTAVVVTTRIDFSFLRGVLMIGGFVALGVIVASIIFGFTLGVIFSGIMVLFAGAAILYQTSAIMNGYRTDQYVAASLALFASVALLFFYVLRILMSLRR